MSIRIQKIIEPSEISSDDTVSYSQTSEDSSTCTSKSSSKDTDSSEESVDMMKATIPRLKIDDDVRQICIVKIDKDYSYGNYGDFRVILMHKNGYINATNLCLLAGKKFGSWKENKNSTELIRSLSSACGIPVGELLVAISGGKNIEIRGTYVHPRLLIHIASWCGPNFAIRISEWIEEWQNYSSINQKRFYAALSEINPSTYVSKEKEIQKILHQKMGGKIEVETTAGKIDLLTDKYLVEIKNYYDWKCAIGQLIAYSYNNKDKIKVVYLFDVPENNIINEIKNICKEYNIRVRIYHDKKILC